MKPSYEELEAKLAETQQLLKVALERIAALEEQLNKNSKNSSKPPSSDRKSNCLSSYKHPKKPRNGIARARLPPEKVDHIHICELECCPDCGSKKVVKEGKPLILQQVELPEAKAIVTQFECTKYVCTSCRTRTFANLPKGIPNSAFGPRLMSLIATLTGVFHLAKRDAIQLVRDLYDITISEGSIINVEERVANSLDEVYEKIHKYVMTCALPKHFDETSWRDQGKNHWVWVGSTSDATCYKIDPNRSKEAFKRFAGQLGQAPVITDRYSAYNDLQNPHQYCLAHLIRDFRKFSEREGTDSEIGKALEKELLQMCKTQKNFREGEISKSSRSARYRYQKKRLDEHIMDGIANGSDELSKLCDRLCNETHKLWAFSEFTNVDPTNNLAERDLRRLVLWRKKSYGTRSDRGQYFVERISTVCETVRKAGEGIFTFINKAVSAFYRNEPAPLLASLGGY